jgi:hypothetical protein
MAGPQAALDHPRALAQQESASAIRRRAAHLALMSAQAGEHPAKGVVIHSPDDRVLA